MRVLGISGSLRRDSYNTSLLRHAGDLFEAEGAEFEIYHGLRDVPRGMKLSKSGVISGTLDDERVASGSYPISVQVSDSKRTKATATLMLKVF
jgi:hypothetical protein